ncbi:MAG: transposase, partial [Candidatus Portnoybacteria bacterium]|nr:transposase [Candidatus Portnoybacteria bacterium]
GVDKRTIFEETEDLNRFFQSMEEFNVLKPIGSIYSNTFKKKQSLLRGKAPKLDSRADKSEEKLVEFVCFCLNPNHYHFMLEQLVDNGIQKFMHKIATGYTGYFNKKYKRTGSLFEGKFKAVLVKSDEDLMYVSAYINLNNRAHNKFVGSNYANLTMSSWDEYIQSNGTDKQGDFCKKIDVFSILKNGEDYKEYAEERLEEIKDNKEIDKYLLEQ